MATLTRDVILGRALDMVGAPALNNNAPIEAHCPTQIVVRSGRMNCIVS